MNINITVNSKKYNLEVDPNESLLSILRDRLHLKGTKNGCSQGQCGACTVVMNDKAVRSCITKAKKLDHSNIITIEGLSDNFRLHPIQEAFVKCTAVQCGFCTPGFIMELYALFKQNNDASEEEIRMALENHLCRCTGYKQILDAALMAQKLL